MTVTLPLFCTPVFLLDLEEFPKEDIIKFIHKEKKKDPKGLVLSNHGGWHSNTHLQSSHNPIEKTVSKGLKKLFTGPEFVQDGKQPLIKNLWAMINNKEDINQWHEHAVLWINVPDEYGKLEFRNPHAYNHHEGIESYNNTLKQNINVWGSYFVHPVEARLCVFPSFLLHRVHSHQSKKERISVSFNIIFN